MSAYVSGQIIETHCSRCRDITGHNVIVCMDGIPLKVECRACGSVHKYSLPRTKSEEKAQKVVRVKAGDDREKAIAEISKTSSASANSSVPSVSHSAAKPKRSGTAENRWHEYASKISSEPIPYAMDGKFFQNCPILHPVFGLGFVLELLPPDKMLVLFREGDKKLRCAL